MTIDYSIVLVNKTVREKKVRFYGYKATDWGTTDYDKKIALERKNNQVFIGGLWLINL